MAIFLNWCKDYSALWHYRSCNLTAKSPQISTRRHHKPDKAGILYAKCATQKVFELSHFMGRVEGSQTRDAQDVYVLFQHLRELLHPPLQWQCGNMPSHCNFKQSGGRLDYKLFTVLWSFLQARRYLDAEQLGNPTETTPLQKNSVP